MHIINRRSVITAIAGSAGLALTGAARAANPITIVYPNVVLQYAPLYIAATQGFFRDEGLEFRLIVGGGGSRARQVLAAGEANVALADVAHALLLTARGRPAKLLSATDRRCAAIQMVIRKDLYDSGITTLEQVANWTRPGGRKPIFGTFSLGGTSHLWASLILERMGINDKVLWLGVGTVDTVMGGLQSQQFDVITCTPAMQADAERMGWGKLILDGLSAGVSDRWFGGEAPVSAHFALKTAIDRDPALIQAYINATYRGAKWLREHTPEQIADALGDYIGSASRASALGELAVNRDVFDYSGLIAEENYARGAAVWFRDLTDVQPIAFADSVDSSFIRRAHEKYGV